MKTNNRRIRALAAAVSVLAVVGAMSALASAGAAGMSGTRYTIKTVRSRGSIWIAGGGKAMRPGRLSAGNRLLETNEIRRADGVKGLFLGTVMVASPGTVAARRAVGMMRGVYRFRDGDVYVDGYVRFAGPSATGVIVGGTGAYRGARGSFASTEAQDILQLLP